MAWVCSHGPLRGLPPLVCKKPELSRLVVGAAGSVVSCFYSYAGIPSEPILINAYKMQPSPQARMSRWSCPCLKVSPFFLSTVLLWFLCPAPLSPPLCSCQPPTTCISCILLSPGKSSVKPGGAPFAFEFSTVKTCKFLKQGNKWSFSQFVFNGKSLPLGANMFSAPINTSYGEIRAEWLHTP